MSSRLHLFSNLYPWNAQLDECIRNFEKYMEAVIAHIDQEYILIHLELNLEYSLLCQQIRKKTKCDEILKKQVINALVLAALLEHIYTYYLMVPREAAYFKEQQAILKDRFIPPIIKPKGIAQFTRETTVEVNLYRVLFGRSKRILDVVANFPTCSETYLDFVRSLNKYVNPVLIHLGWFFYMPRLFINLYILAKHTLPGTWMSDKEKNLGISVRFRTQLKRRWFDLSNDIVWVFAGLINCFLLTGALAPIGVYLSLACFAIDIILSAAQAYIELARLYALQNQYTYMETQFQDKVEKTVIEEHLKTIEHQINCDKWRLGSQVGIITAVFLSACCAAPLFAANPIIPLIGAVCLVIISLINFALRYSQTRPENSILPSGTQKFGFFSNRKELNSSPLSLDKPINPGGFNN